MAVVRQQHPMAFSATNPFAVAATTQANLGYLASAGALGTSPVQALGYLVSAYQTASQTAQALTTRVMLAGHPSGMQGSLPAGLRCLYQSERFGWVSCVIIKFNNSDGTYDLDIRQQASADKIAPVAQAGPNWIAGDFSASIWPAGSIVCYHSRSTGVWMPTEIRSFNFEDGTYQLGVCEHAKADRIRAHSVRVPPSTPVPSSHLQVPQSMPMSTTAFPPQVQPSMPGDDASIEPIVHPGHEPRQDEVLVAVIVTISDGGSYDQLFNKIPQLAGEGKRVASYAVSGSSLRYISGELSGHPVRDGRSAALHRNLRHLIRDISSVQADSVVFNWECCGGCSNEHFHNSPVVLGLVKRLLDRGHMLMFSDFSLKALIKDWQEDLLGPNPFVKTGEFNSGFKLRFDPGMLSSCPSAQLQKLGELASNGEAQLNAMSNTIAFSVKWQKADCSTYNCKVLTVMTELDGSPASPTPGEGCEVGGHRGFAGHVLLTYPSGGRILASAGHWVELSRLDVTEAALLAAAASYGATFQNEIRTSMASCSTRAERHQTLSTLSTRMIQSSSPGSYSGSGPATRPRPATMPAV